MATAEGTGGGRATEVGREGRELAGNAVTAPLTAASQPRTWRPRHLPALPAPSLGTRARGERFQSRHGPRIGGDPQSSGLISLINSQLITWPSEEDVGSVGPRRGLAERGEGARGPPHCLACRSSARRRCSFSVTATWCGRGHRASSGTLREPEGFTRAEGSGRDRDRSRPVSGGRTR